MTFQDILNNVLNALPPEEKERLTEVAKRDEALFKETLAETLRLFIMAKTGNTRAWAKWQNEQEENMTSFLRELENETNIAAIKKQLQEI